MVELGHAVLQTNSTNGKSLEHVGLATKFSTVLLKKLQSFGEMYGRSGSVVLATGQIYYAFTYAFAEN